ncbi:unnamed protein product [Rotaria magnacalcarata]|uniref:BED-type domain-containing protein n=1 Tax=Rotaria magnacalcarata TaxID=392030 RepID=A0A816MZF3_9BILA|nr:unnamed protein product [Rotaria magnacalcarata]
MVHPLSHSDSEMSSNEVISGCSSSISFESPKHGGRQRDSIWLHFNDMGPAKTLGHSKVQCKYCLLCLNFAKLNMMYTHIAHQFDEIINYDPNARKEIIIQACKMEEQLSPGRNNKRIIDVVSNDPSLRKQSTMDRFTSRIISYSEQQNIDRDLLRAAIMNGDLRKHAYAKSVAQKVTAVTSFCNHSHAFKAKLKEEAQRIKLKTETLHTIVTTRWSSMAECLDSFIVLRAPLEALVATDESIAPIKIINIINNRSFFHDIENLYKVMKPLAYAMSIIQSASITLADCYLILQYLRLTIDQYANNAETRTFGRFISKVAEIRLKECHNDLYLNISEADNMLNTKDRRFQQILIDLGFIEETQLITAQDEGLTDDEENDKMSNEDYDVQELLIATIGI